MTAADLDALPEAEARGLLTACCGARAWVASMLAARPWRERAALFAAAEGAWQALSPEQLAEAVAHHPRLGEARAAAELSARASGWSAREQAGAQAAGDEVRRALAAGNLEYERRFGHTFILCAAGRGAEDMLSALRARLANDPRTELAITAAELKKIALSRLEKLLADA
jgi:2-oxo-4-hydroxy-4-carboxy-5-ureidoimidazoline decarboxylase